MKASAWPLCIAAALLASACGNGDGPRKRNAKRSGVAVSSDRLKTVTLSTATAENRNRISIQNLEVAERWFRVPTDASGSLKLKNVAMDENCEVDQLNPVGTLELVRTRSAGNFERTPLYSSAEQVPGTGIDIDPKVETWVAARVLNYGHCTRVELVFDIAIGE